MIMISVVIPTYNRKKLLEKCLESLANQSYKDYEVIVVGDVSTGGTGSLIREMQKRFKNIRHFRQEALGHSMARNFGFSKAMGEIIASIDDDCTAEPGWLKRIDAAFKKHPNVAAVGGAVINPINTRISWSYHILGFSDWFPGMRKRFVRNIPTCNIAYRKESIAGMEFEDDRRILGYRDSLFNMGVLKRGRILFDPEIRVFHHRWAGKHSVAEFLKTQRRQALGFYHGGYKVHRAGSILRFFWPLGLLCPRLSFVLYRCTKTGTTKKFISNLPLIVRGEVERGRKYE
jgi:glycosyltransferase involved in cell wall biosynthesis